MGREDEAYITGSSSRRRRLSVIFMLLAIVVAMVVAIGVALGGGGMAVAKKPDVRATNDATIEATSFQVEAKQLKEAYAKCPGNKRALGGGVVQSGAASNETNLYVRASGPLDSSGVTAQTESGDIAKQWYAAVVNQGLQPQDLKVFAICSAKSNATIQATSFQVEARQAGAEIGATKEAYAKCPGNKRALGGGVVQSGPANGLYVRASGPLDSSGVTAQTVSGSIPKQWYAAVANAETQPRDLKVFAICSAKSRATVEATSFQVGAKADTNEAYAKCPGNKRALGGGVVQSGAAPGIVVRASGPLGETNLTAETVSGDIAKQWYAAVYNFTAGASAQPRDLKVFAICQ